MAERRLSVFWETVETIAVALILTLVIRHFVVESFVVRGSSMEPTLHDGERLLVSKFTYRLHPPRVGDIIVFRNPENQREDLIKRVIAVEGQQVEIRNGRAVVDGRLMDEPFISRPDESYRPPLAVPKGKVFVMGDNRPNSTDSRILGPIDRALIKGKTVLIWWPVSKMALVP